MKLISSKRVSDSYSDNRKSKTCTERRRSIENRKLAGVLALVAAFAMCGAAALAQQPKKVFRIGYLSSFDPASDSDGTEGIRLALRGLGYVEGQNIATEYRYAEGKLDRLPELSAELVRLRLISSWHQEGAVRSRRPRMQLSRFPSL